MKALALVEASDHVCARYRVSAFEPALDAAGWSLTVDGLAAGPIARVRQLRGAAGYDAVLLQRKLLPGWQAAILRRSTRRLLFDFDDAVLYRDSYDSRGPHSRRRAARFSRIVRAADLVLAGNDFLAECAAIHGARTDHIRVVPTCIATDRYRSKDETSSRDPMVRLVWIGSSSTMQGIERQRPLLERLGREFPNLRLRLISDRFPRFDPLPVESVPWSQQGEAIAIAGGDIGISWVPDDLWSRGKCGLKVLQYGAAGLPTVANPVGVHSRMIAEGQSGFLPSTEEEWVEAIRMLSADPELRRRLGRAARAKVEADFSVAAWSAGFVAAIAGSGLVPPPKNPTLGKAVPR
ncbi:MAG: glycosyltransferase [Planctomycetota bacterium]|nr:glycosyltransferase [Planctomycetota bacterium]